MEVFVLEGGWEYEGTEVVGVYASAELALEAQEELQREQPDAYDFTTLATYEVSE